MIEKSVLNLRNFKKRATMDKSEKLKSSEIIIFKTEDEKISVDVRFEDETAWLSIDDMAKLFEKSRSTINEHILNIYAEEELTETDTMRKIGISDFSTKPTKTKVLVHKL